MTTTQPANTAPAATDICPQVDYAGYGDDRARTDHVCDACGTPINPGEPRYLMTERAADEPTVLAASHTYSSYQDGRTHRHHCPDVLDGLWQERVRSAGAGILHGGFDHGEYHWDLGDEPLRAGSPVELLHESGVWLPGHFEYIRQPDGTTTPTVWIALAGWNNVRAVVTLPPGAVLRFPQP